MNDSQCECCYRPVAVKRRFIPDWFLSISMIAFGRLLLHNPLRWMFFKKGGAK